MLIPNTHEVTYSYFSVCFWNRCLLSMSALVLIFVSLVSLLGVSSWSANANRKQTLSANTESRPEVWLRSVCGAFKYNNQVMIFLPAKTDLVMQTSFCNVWILDDSLHLKYWCCNLQMLHLVMQFYPLYAHSFLFISMAIQQRDHGHMFLRSMPQLGQVYLLKEWLAHCISCQHYLMFYILPTESIDRPLVLIFQI